MENELERSTVFSNEQLDLPAAEFIKQVAQSLGLDSVEDLYTSFQD
jgi:hypothetical protein